MTTILPHVPPAVSLMCTDCEGSWLADWLLEWEFTTCPNCGGELRPPTWIDRERTGRQIAGPEVHDAAGSAATAG